MKPLRPTTRLVLADCGLAVALVGLRLVALSVMAEWDPPPPPPPVWHHALVGLAIAAVVARGFFPRSVFVIACALALVLESLPYPTWIGVWALVCALYAVASVCTTGWTVSAVLLSVASLMTPAFVADNAFERAPDFLMVLVMLNISMAVLGQVVRRSRQRAVRLEQALELLEEVQQRQTAEAVLVERNRIARELHDIVAHGLSLIVLRAGVARMLLPDDPVQAKEAVQVIENAARESSAEMRHMLEALRSLDDEEQDMEPQPDLDRLDDLMDAVRGHGLLVDFVRDGTPRPLPPGQELAAYRIVQEALTNVLKHAGLVKATATLRYLPDKLVVEVFNEASQDRSTSRARSTKDGPGLIGMRERVALYGGVLRVGAVQGGFRVRAELPVAKK